MHLESTNYTMNRLQITMEILEGLSPLRQMRPRPRARSRSVRQMRRSRLPQG